MEDQLQELITEVQTLKVEIFQYTKGGLEWTKATKRLRKALDRLLNEIPRLPGLAACSHPDYPELLDDILMEVTDKINEFQPKHDSIQKSLVSWINYKLRLIYRVKDLCYRCPHPVLLSLDQPLTSEGSITFGENLSDADLCFPHPLQPESNIAYQMWDYILQDPEELLQHCVPQKFPHCNAQKVAIMLYSGSYYKKNGLPKLRAIADEFGIHEQTFYSYWRKHCQPLLEGIARKFKDSQEEEE